MKCRCCCQVGGAPSLGWPCRFRCRFSSSAVASSSSSSSSRRRRSRTWFSDNSRSRRWWSDDQQLDDDEFDHQDEEGPWFSKVWNAYGYVLPLILASMLVVTGPQAFLMAMAIPLAQSAFSFLLRYAFAPRNQDDLYDDYYDDVDSWALNEEPAATTTSTTKTKKSVGGFGGWDEFDDDNIKQEIRRRRTRAYGGGRRSSINIGYKEAPLLMRLLVAVFPFLGSWFRML